MQIINIHLMGRLLAIITSIIKVMLMQIRMKMHSFLNISHHNNNKKLLRIWNVFQNRQKNVL